MEKVDELVAKCSETERKLLKFESRPSESITVANDKNRGRVDWTAARAAREPAPGTTRRRSTPLDARDAGALMIKFYAVGAALVSLCLAR